MTTEPPPPGPPAAAAPPPPRARRGGGRDWLRIGVIWVVLSVAADVVWIKLVGPHVPPGRMTDTAIGAAFDFNVLIVLALPVLIGVWVYMLYAVVSFRASKGGPDPVAGPGSRGSGPIESTWIVITTVIVLFLAGFGTYELIQPEGSGGGQGPTPLWTPASKDVLQVQVIGQQWKWTYRYPSFGGFETNQLIVPVNTSIAFHVTSLDVIHSFWAYQLGVKADANPSSDNVAFTTPVQQGYFIVRCNELCGLWHGAMYNEGQVVSKAAFESWATSTEAMLAQNTKLLPPFAYSYVPDANGADGGYYPDTKDPYSPVETYGAQTPAGGG
ncbi:MAG TPA: cytochrome c oxidase subunit II [Acidimicrobiales bacterium]|nr:cytochrome c oxidase subunit II [Acidimicrobiales bacterium]